MKRGFTIVELLVVIAIIVLAWDIATNIVNKSKKIDTADTVKQTQEQCYHCNK